MNKEEFLEYQPIQNQGFVGDISFEDWEYGQDVFSDMQKIVASDAATIIFPEKRSVKQFLREENIPFKVHMAEVYLHSPSPFHVVKILEEYCVYGFCKYMTLFLGNPCEFRLEQFGKKGGWDIGRYLNGHSVGLTLLENEPTLYVSAQNEQDCENFIQLIEQRLDDKIVPFMDYKETNLGGILVPPAFLKEFNLPVEKFRISARLLNSPNAGNDDALSQLFAGDNLQMIAIASSYDDTLDELGIDYHLDNRMLLSEPIAAERREATINQLHKESFLERVYLFYGNNPDVKVRKNQTNSFLKKLFSYKSFLDFNLEEGGKAVILLFDGELAVMFENV
ncbi:MULTISPECIES: hypothetical protein [Listeria]|uniref:hypothetical protein n=1 Tax=Listeria TaxID=1637 RepID=UPI000B58CBF5|nr:MULTISPECIES: hypothetical protein [Listeria]